MKSKHLDQYETEIYCEDKQPVNGSIKKTYGLPDPFTNIVLVLLYVIAALACTGLIS